jgi:hypothetical protein
MKIPFLAPLQTMFSKTILLNSGVLSCKKNHYFRHPLLIIQLEILRKKLSQEYVSKACEKASFISGDSQTTTCCVFARTIT